MRLIASQKPHVVVIVELLKSLQSEFRNELCQHCSLGSTFQWIETTTIELQWEARILFIVQYFVVDIDMIYFKCII